MKQYEFEMIDEQHGRIDRARATAASAAIARAQIVLMYAPRYDVADMVSSVAPAHHVAGEIDCSEKEIIIYGLPCGEKRDYMEDILANFPATDKASENIEKVTA